MSITHIAATPRVVLASNEAFALESVGLAIKLCRENNSMLDLLCVSPEDCDTDINLSAVLTRLLLAENELDFQITRRRGKLLEVIETYLHSRLDTLITIINVNDKFKNKIKFYRLTENWFRTSKLPALELMDDLIQA